MKDTTLDTRVVRVVGTPPDPVVGRVLKIAMALVETNSDVEAVVVSPPLAEAVSVTVDSDPLAIVEIVSTEVRPTDSVEIVKIPMVVICVIELIDAVGVVVALADAEAEGYAEFSPVTEAVEGAV